MDYRTTHPQKLLLSALMIGALTLASEGSADAAATLPVFGYQAESDPTSLLTASAAALGSVGVDGVNITSVGTGVSIPDADAKSQLAKAHALGKPAEFLVGNFSDAIGDFDEAAAYRMLSNSGNIRKVVATLKAAVTSQGWNGVDIDLESLSARDTNGLVNFLTALKAALPAGKTVSVAVTNYASLADFQAGGYDLYGIGQVVDRVVLMAYDLHGFGDSGPGPIGPLAWQSTGLDIVLGEVDANKVDLGVAGYGYQWTDNGAVTQLSDAQARTAAGSKARWDTTASTPSQSRVPRRQLFRRDRRLRPGGDPPDGELKGQSNQSHQVPGNCRSHTGMGRHPGRPGVHQRS